MNIYVSNLGENVTTELLHITFSWHGTVKSCRVIKDHATGVSRGFGFVEMTNETEAATAINKVNGSVLDERRVFAKKANERPAPKGTLIERLRGY
jgi:RNA recognition motif-containing protein